MTLLNLLSNVQVNASLLKLISVRVLDMLKLIALFLVAIPALIMVIGLMVMLRDDPRISDGHKRQSKN